MVWKNTRFSEYKPLSIYNLPEDNLRHFLMIAQCDLTESEKEVDYYHQKLNEKLPHKLANKLKLRSLRNK